MLIGFKVCIFKIARKYWEEKRDIRIYCEILDSKRTWEIYRSSYFVSPDMRALPEWLTEHESCSTALHGHQA